MRAKALAHPNIALIKYWGKQDERINLPAVGSLSITLDTLCSETTVEFDPSFRADELLINDVPDAAAMEKAAVCLDMLRELAGSSHRVRIHSTNNFPTGAGLASSASGIAALVTASAAALGIEPEEQKLAEIARRGSGSAPRSLYGGYVLLNLDSSGGTRCEQVLAPEEWPLAAVVAITSQDKKSTGSTAGMVRSRQESPYYGAWIESHPADLDACLQHIQQRDFSAVAALAEHSCMKMHALAMSTNPALIYWLPATLECIRTVESLRAKGVPVFFTIDAGPQVKAICEPDALEAVNDALSNTPGVLETINVGLGAGARMCK
ncbi:MAG: diphosphomevalonate decarboxylase [Gammaproteobacteria bacterium]